MGGIRNRLLKESIEIKMPSEINRIFPLFSSITVKIITLSIFFYNPKVFIHNDNVRSRLFLEIFSQITIPMLLIDAFNIPKFMALL